MLVIIPQIIHVCEELFHKHYTCYPCSNGKNPRFRPSRLVTFHFDVKNREDIAVEVLSDILIIPKSGRDEQNSRAPNEEIYIERTFSEQLLLRLLSPLLEGLY